MIDAKRPYYELVFERNFLKFKSNQFEDFFSEIMEKRHLHHFQRIRPYGNVGDKKCDGHLTLSDQVTIFQVYAPNELKAVDAIDKIKEDFKGALNHWPHMNRWVFVHNATNGLPPQVKQTLDEVRRTNSSIEIEHWGYETLKKITFELDEHNLSSLLGQVPVYLENNDLIPVLKKTIAEMEEEFIDGFSIELQEIIRCSFSDICKKILGIEINDVKRFLHKYRIPSEYKYSDNEGLQEVLQLLTLLNVNSSAWSILDSGTANIKLNENEFRQILYSVKKETMPEIILSFAERFKGSETRIFKHPLILENFRFHSKKNLCRTCGGERKSYGQILIDYGRGSNKSPFLELEPNDYRSLDEIVVNCSNCIRNEIEDVTTEEELRLRLKGVM